MVLSIEFSSACREIPRDPMEHPRAVGAHPALGLATSSRCLSLQAGDFHDPGDRQRKVPGALALPFPGCRAILGVGSRLELLLTPGLPNLPSPVSSTSCVYLAARSPRGREEEEGGEPLPLPLRPGELCYGHHSGLPGPSLASVTPLLCLWERRGSFKPGFASRGALSRVWMVQGWAR